MPPPLKIRRVLFYLPVTETWICDLLCRVNIELPQIKIAEWWNCYGMSLIFRLSVGTIHFSGYRWLRSQAGEINQSHDLSAIRVGLHDEIYQGEFSLNVQVTDAGTPALGASSSITINLNDLAGNIEGNNDNNVINGNIGADTISGGAGNDLLRGGSENDFIDGGIGNDRLYGNSGNDTLLGGAGIDLLVGDAGDDLLDGGASGDRLYGLQGAEIFVLRSGEGGDFIYDFQLGSDLLGLDGISVGSINATADTSGNHTLITNTDNNEVLATLFRTTATAFNASSNNYINLADT